MKKYTITLQTHFTDLSVMRIFIHIIGIDINKKKNGEGEDWIFRCHWRPRLSLDLGSPGEAYTPSTVGDTRRIETTCELAVQGPSIETKPPKWCYR